MVGKDRKLIYFFLFFILLNNVYAVDWTYSPSQINIYLFKDLNFSFQLPYLIINGSNVSLDERTLNNTIKNNKVFNASWADNASSVHCSGIGGATTNLCTITSSTNDPSIYNTANNFTKDYSAEYSSTGWKLANDTTAWHDLYTSVGYQFSNLTDDIGNSTNITLTVVNNRLVATFNMSCQQITGSADLCDSNDATGTSSQPTTEQIYLNITSYLGGKNSSIPNLIDNATFFNSKQSEASAFKIENGTSLPFSNFRLENVSNITSWSNIINIPAFSNFQLANVSNNSLVKGDNTSIALWNIERSILFTRSEDMVIKLGNYSKMINYTNDTFTLLGSGAVYGSLNFTTGNTTNLLATNLRTGNLFDIDGSNLFDYTGFSTSTTCGQPDDSGDVTCSAISITNSQVSDFAAGVIANEQNPSNATIVIASGQITGLYINISNAVNSTSSFGGEVTGSYNSIVLSNTALDDQYVRVGVHNNNNLSRIGNIDINTSGSLNASGNITFPQLKSCDTINTDATGLLTCGNDATGVGSAGNGDGGINFTNWNSTGNLVYTNDSIALVGIGIRPVYRLDVSGNASFGNITVGWNKTSPMVNISGSTGNVDIAGTLKATILNVITLITGSQIDWNFATSHFWTKTNSTAHAAELQLIKNTDFSIANNISNRTSINNINEIVSYNQSVKNYVTDTNISMLQYIEQGKSSSFTLGQNGSTVVLTTNLKNALGNLTDIKVNNTLIRNLTVLIGNITIGDGSTGGYTIYKKEGQCNATCWCSYLNKTLVSRECAN